MKPKEKPATADRSESACAWEDSTWGEGAASALETLRKLERERDELKPTAEGPAGDRPSSD